jgi:hypothetical protein
VCLFIRSNSARWRTFSAAGGAGQLGERLGRGGGWVAMISRGGGVAFGESMVGWQIASVGSSAQSIRTR